MDLYTINYIKNNPLIHNYLREKSYWYKYLNRNSSNLKLLEQEMKKAYKLTAEDRIEKLSNSINIISSLFDALN